MNTSIGHILRQARIAKKMTLEDVEEVTSIETPYLLAIELDNYSALPEDILPSEYVTRYADAVGVKESDLKRVRSEQDKLDNPKVELPNEHYRRAKGHQSVRSYRRQKVYFLPLLYISLVALAILVFIGYIVTKQLEFESQSQTAQSSYTVVNSSSSETASSSSEVSSSSEDSTKPKLTVQKSSDGYNLAVTLTNPSSTGIPVIVSLSGATSSWFSVTNSDLDDSGVTLNSSRTNYTATLTDGATSSVITLGVTKDVTVFIDNQVVDLSSLTSDGISYITLTIEE
ncbi:helix-turn-helix domain-containing protein [Streptococcus loxodontisalivarius]|uniref:Cytoskeletal protein RodZ n=1 Tax=Streptococcus loxodontisalivarius TaxID=1349415 RepID=A0ABS2PPD6_9STRE|nr:helix-turn-helix domain-containing protein [Streptococcus loxodontisalivarius]MBM7641897.1 cytoskeletal protein RodZ [Streptococcus loxodontisalivarius]